MQFKEKLLRFCRRSFAGGEDMAEESEETGRCSWQRLWFLESLAASCALIHLLSAYLG